MQIKIDSILPNIIEAVLPRFSENKGVLFCIRVSFSHYYENGQEMNIDKWVYILFHRPNNYTRVFSMILDKPIWGKNFEENLKWCLECDHDSCWRSDGLHFLWDLERDIIGQFKEKNLDYYGSIYMEFMNFVELDKYEYKDYHQREMKIKLKTVER